MKKLSISLLIILLLQNYQSFSQTTLSKKQGKWHKQHAMINSKLFQQSKKNYKKSTERTTDEIAERLLAYNHYNIGDTTSPFGLMDTAFYTYSSTRSSIFNYNTMDYDNSYPMTSSYVFGFYSGVGFMNHNDEPTILCDTALFWSSGLPYDTLTFVDTKYSIYDSSDNVLDYADLFIQDSFSSYIDNRYCNTFDTNKNITMSIALSWTYGVWDTTENRLFIYNTNHQVIEDSSNMYLGGGLWFPQEKWTYTYNDSGKMASANYYMYNGTGWQENIRYKMDYYSDNNLKIDSISVLNSAGTNWEPDTKDTFGFTAGINFWTYYRNYNYYADTNRLFSYYTWNKNVSTLGLPDTLYENYSFATGNRLKSSLKEAFTYDTYSEPRKMYSYIFHITDTSTGAGWYDSTSMYIYNFFYQLYDKHNSSVPPHPRPHPHNNHLPQPRHQYIKY